MYKTYKTTLAFDTYTASIYYFIVKLTGSAAFLMSRAKK